MTGHLRPREESRGVVRFVLARVIWLETAPARVSVAVPAQCTVAWHDGAVKVTSRSWERVEVA